MNVGDTQDWLGQFTSLVGRPDSNQKRHAPFRDQDWAILTGILETPLVVISLPVAETNRAEKDGKLNFVARD